MCGIFGVIQKESRSIPDKDLLGTIAHTLEHRGPDSYDVYADEGIGLVHTRLSLLDLTSRSNQPFWDRTKRYCLVYNGEIYNFQELGQDLSARGVVLRTTSDTEVLLEELIHADSLVSVLPHLEGMFAFGLFDTLERSLKIGRDRFGIKPLYVYDTDEVFIFSSEVKAIAQYVTLEPDLLSISSFIQGFGGPTKNHTFFRNVRAVPPGSFIEVRPGSPPQYGSFFSIADFWDEDEAEELRLLPAKVVVDRTEEHLLTSVKKHLIADAPVGALCSGGIDSSLILAMAATFHNNLAIFHANVVGANSEYSDAMLLAKHLKLDLESVEVQEEGCIDAIPEVMEHYEHPFTYHPNSIPFLRVAQLVRNQGVKAVLSGEGSDECYLGYDSLADDHPLMIYLRLPRHIQTFMRKIPKVRALIPPENGRDQELLLHLLNRFEVLLDREEVGERIGEGDPDGGHKLTLDLLNYHLRTLLHRNDCLGMAASVEARFPFLDHALVKLAVNMPYDVKIRFDAFSRHPRRFLKNKWVIRQIGQKYLPSRLSEKEKLGFPFSGFGLMRIPTPYFQGSPIADMFGLSSQALDYLLEQASAAVRLKLFHLDVWSHVCLYRLPRQQLLNRLHDHLNFPQTTY